MAASEVARADAVPAATGGPGRWPARLGRAARSAGRAVPPTGLILVGIASVQSGSAVAKTLFGQLPPPGVVLLRLGFAAVLLLPRFRWRRDGTDGIRRGWRDAAVAGGLGLTMAGTTLAFYESLDRIPLGIAVTVEFCGPLGVAVAGSRRRLDALWVLLAGLGVVLLARGGGSVTVLGVAFAALAGVGWAGYILFTAAVGRRFDGVSGLALACTVGALASLPFGLVASGARLRSAQTLLLGGCVAVLSGLIPYSVELRALRHIPARTFGLLMSMEPAVAALIGFAVLGEVLSVREWLAIGLVVAACVGATRSAATGS
ncbi:MAG TPA: EamA family transporter [Mycobacteriales bacterium]|nr:EamA family transporter [Mycobacteriales bacterium]